MKIRKILIQDTEWFFETLETDKAVRDSITGIPEKITLEDCKRQVELMSDSYIIIVNGFKVGFVSCDNNELSYFILEKYRGKGYCKKAVRRVLQIYDKHLLEAKPVNLVSRHILIEFGIKTPQEKTKC